MNLQAANETFDIYVTETLVEIKSIKDAIQSNSHAIHAPSFTTLCTMIDVAESKLEQFDKKSDMTKDQGRRVCEVIGSILKAIDIVDASTRGNLSDVFAQGCRANSICRFAGNDFIKLGTYFKSATDI